MLVHRTRIAGDAFVQQQHRDPRRLGACACGMHAVTLVYTHTHAQLVDRYVVSERKVVSGLGIRTMKGSHPFVLRQNSDTARTRRGRDQSRVGETERERERKRESAKEGACRLVPFRVWLSLGNIYRVTENERMRFEQSEGLFSFLKSESLL